MSTPSINPAIAIAQAHMEGKSPQAIANGLGIPREDVATALRTKPVKALMKELKDRLIYTSLPKAVSNVEEVIQDFSNPVELDIDLKPRSDSLQKKDMGFKASMKLMESAGLITSSQAPVYITNINNSVNITPIINNLLDNELKSVMKPAIDASFETLAEE